MKRVRVSLTELERKLGEYLRLVMRGETVEILEGSVPVARIEKIERPAGGSHERLVRDGIVSRPSRRPSADLVGHPPVPCDPDVVQALLEERGDR